MSTLTTAIIINAGVLLATLEADIGTRRIGRFRLLRPILVSAAIVPVFVRNVVLSGSAPLIQLSAVVLGIGLGLLVVSRFRVSVNPAGRPVSRAGWSYALLWTAIMAARTGFSLGLKYSFGASVAKWMVQHGIALADVTPVITDALIFSAIAMMVTRTAVLGLRGHRAVRLAMAPA